ncbi:MAG: hypothetical protein U0166_23850 [Acidobacteriota bacterium]
MQADADRTAGERGRPERLRVRVAVAGVDPDLVARAIHLHVEPFERARGREGFEPVEPDLDPDLAPVEDVEVADVEDCDAPRAR